MQLINRIQDSMLPEFKQAALKSLSQYRYKGRIGWLLAPAVLVALLLWNVKLLVATSTGVLVMLGVYLMHEWDLHSLREKLRNLLGGANRPLTIAVGSGGLATLSTYMAASLWMESESHWMAIATIFQGLGTIAVFALLVWQIFSRQAGRHERNFNKLVADLTHPDCLKRLISVRQLTRLGRGDRLAIGDRRAILDYFRLMLTREQEPLLRDALLDGLQVLDAPKQLSSGAQPLSIPVQKKRATAKNRQPIA